MRIACQRRRIVSDGAGGFIWMIERMSMAAGRRIVARGSLGWYAGGYSCRR
jgi:hypothetical protein